MTVSCCVIGCKSKGNGQPGVQFFNLPLNKPNILTQWLIVLDRRDWIPKPSSRICSLHFSQDDYVLKPNTNVLRLKPEAIPSVFPDLSSTEEQIFEELVQMIAETPTVTKDVTKPSKSKSVEAISKPPVVNESPSQRPRRVSKINPRMKDYILLDDIKKHKQNLLQSTPGKSQASEKDKAARELLSILEDSNSLSGDESTSASKDAASNLSPISLGQKSSSSNISNSSEKISMLKSEVLSNGDSVAKVSEKLSNKKSLTGGETSKARENISSTSNSGKDVSSSAQPKRRLVATKSTARGLSSKSVNPKLLSSFDQLTPKIDKQIASGSRCSNEENASESSKKQQVVQNSVPVAFRKTYFKVKQGRKVYYFSYSDLNPIVIMKNNNVLYNKATDGYYTSLEEVNASLGEVNCAAASLQDDSELQETENNKVDDICPSEDDNIDALEPIDNADSCLSDVDSDMQKSPYMKPSKTKDPAKQGNLASGSLSKKKRGRPRTKPPTVNNHNEKNSVIPGNLSVQLIGDSPSPSSVGKDPSTSITIETEDFKTTTPAPVKRKKRFTVAEIVVRTENTGQGTSFSIDKINNLVDLEKGMPPSKKIKRAVTSMFSPETNVTAVPHLSINSDTTEEELDALAAQIKHTVKNMNLIEKVRGKPVKITILITSLPPIHEKEIIKITKTNLITNTTEVRQLQVAISNCKPQNDNTLSGAISSSSIDPGNLFSVLGTRIIDECFSDGVNKQNTDIVSNEKTGDKPTDADASAQPSIEHSLSLSDAPSENSTQENTEKNTQENTETKEQEVSDVVNEQDLSEPVIAVINATNPTIESTENAPPMNHDHNYISPSSKAVSDTNVDLAENPIPEIPDPEGGSNEAIPTLMLSEEEISYRRKVVKKIRNLKENVKRKTEIIFKLKEKVKFLEKTLRDERRIKKHAVKPSNTEEKTNLFEHIIDNTEDTKSMDCSLNVTEGRPTEFEENVESEEDERICSSPITYLCEPAIEPPEKLEIEE